MSDIIKLLPDSVANQIAAGEVIQRPASVVKELVENSVDAEATDITLVVKDAGRTLIQVIDNGRGMSTTDARMAFERHATSKIRSADDLFALHTMGFRGEALASIAAIAQLDVCTCPKGEEVGTRLTINGSKVESQLPEQCPEGTNLKVKNLFFNVPARRKFLKKDTVEMGQIMREFERLALVNPDLRLTLIHNDVTLHSLMPASLLTRIGDLFGKNVDKGLVKIDADTSVVRLEGYIGLPEHARRRGALQYFFVNGRNMRHPLFHKAVMQCYEQLLPPDMQPNYFISFTVDPQTIDVNIHPTKSEIKFENEGAIRQILIAAVREGLGRFNAGPSIVFDQNDAPNIPAFIPDSKAEHGVNLDPDYNPFDIRPQRPQRDWDALYADFERRARESAVTGLTPADEEPQQVTLQGELDIDATPVSAPMMQLHNRYIITPSREGLIIIDQHRAHVRILFERYRLRNANGHLASQRVMFPELLQLSPALSSVLQSILKEVERFGFEVNYLGDNAWNILAAPSALSDANARDLLTVMVEQAAAGFEAEGADEQLRDRMALSLARAGAIKAGQPLNGSEMDRLSSELFKLASPALTPDGHRTFIILSADEIARTFG